jgi:glutamate synthase (NADPH/NADH) large chain
MAPKRSTPIWLSTRCSTCTKGEFPPEVDRTRLSARYIKSIGKGILKVMSKMGISTYQSYCGAQIFDAVGLSSDFVNTYFTGTATTIEGVGLDEVADRKPPNVTAWRFPTIRCLPPRWKWAANMPTAMRGEEHAWTPDAVATLQHAVRGNAQERYREFAEMVNARHLRMNAIRGLFHIKHGGSCRRKPVPLDEVEPAADIVKRFSTGAMSFGSISREAHTTLAIAMNQIGGKSNTGEGGEEPDRYLPLPAAAAIRSARRSSRSPRAGSA